MSRVLFYDNIIMVVTFTSCVIRTHMLFCNKTRVQIVKATIKMPAFFTGFITLSFNTLGQ